MTDVKKYITENKAAWESAAPIHSEGVKEIQKQIMQDDNYIPICDELVRYLSKVGVKDKACLHLCCNNGFEIVGLKRMGASECVGIDFCEYNISYAYEFSDQLGYGNSVRFVQANVTDEGLAEMIGRTFDVIYISTGSLCWIDDLSALYKNISRLLSPGGKVIVCDLHPMCSIINDNKDINEPPLLIVKHYFTTKPSTYIRSLDYISRSSQEKQTYHLFSHTFTEIIQKALEHKLQLCFFDETEIDVSGGFSRVESMDFHFPLYFCVIFKKICTEDELWAQ